MERPTEQSLWTIISDIRLDEVTITLTSQRNWRLEHVENRINTKQYM